MYEKLPSTLKAPPIICSRQQFQILPIFSKITNKAYIIPYFFRKFGKMLKNLLSAAAVIGALRVKNVKLSSFTTADDDKFCDFWGEGGGGGG